MATFTIASVLGLKASALGWLADIPAFYDVKGDGGNQLLNGLREL